MLILSFLEGHPQCSLGSLKEATEELPLCSGSRTRVESFNMPVASAGTARPLKPSMGSESRMPGQLVFSILHPLPLPGHFILGSVDYVGESQSSSGYGLLTWQSRHYPLISALGTDGSCLGTMTCGHTQPWMRGHSKFQNINFFKGLEPASSGGRDIVSGPQSP